MNSHPLPNTKHVPSPMNIGYSVIMRVEDPVGKSIRGITAFAGLAAGLYRGKMYIRRRTYRTCLIYSLSVLSVSWNCFGIDGCSCFCSYSTLIIGCDLSSILADIFDRLKVNVQDEDEDVEMFWPVPSELVPARRISNVLCVRDAMPLCRRTLFFP
ncbi:hypothetical protein ARMGADRAFT_49188 [Armillaria gallica]|uniref:Uncharacterized protein n=1 Tax=Armillaria gallica TaxID=47427 RepID=A0A2H3EA58_ARMGA|nr:hypothetical protein ARMGADRAFT_49188 [Armillaria gallica]